jgi:hypothetical protein
MMEPPVLAAVVVPVVLEPQELVERVVLVLVHLLLVQVILSEHLDLVVLVDILLVVVRVLLHLLPPQAVQVLTVVVVVRDFNEDLKRMMSTVSKQPEVVEVVYGLVVMVLKVPVVLELS